MQVSVVVPNWNGEDVLNECLDSLLAQSLKPKIIVVDNGSTDNSLQVIGKYKAVEVLPLKKNHGFAGGVNAGIKRALEHGAEYVALLNNDATADKNWLKNLLNFLESNPKAGIVTSKILDETGEHLDSTGDLYTVWGLPYPRGRGESDREKYDNDTWVFGASGGASIYRIKMLQEIGLFDEDFFAYYEDVDLSFRAQLAGWKVAYVPKAVVYHQIGATSSQIRGFASYHTLKNLPLLLWKNVPWELMPKIYPRFFLAYWTIAARSLTRGQFGPFFKGIIVGSILWPIKLVERYKIQKRRKVSVSYIDSIITHDLPPNAHKLRQLRSWWWKLRGKRI